MKLEALDTLITPPTKLERMKTITKLDSALAILSQITLLQEATATATANSSKCESALAKAEEDEKMSTTDDGESSPEGLYQRGENARKNVFLRRTEAQRASEKLAEAESEFGGFVTEHLEEIISIIADAIERISDSLREKLLPLVAGGDSHVKAKLDEFIRECDGVRDLRGSMNRIRLGAAYQEWNNIANECGRAIKLIEEGSPSGMN